MKILSLNHSDTSGGAARASFRIFEALYKTGSDIEMLVKYKNSSHEKVLEISSFHRKDNFRYINALKSKLENIIYKNKVNKYDLRSGTFLSNLSSISLNAAFQQLDFDIIHLHWVAHQFLDLKELKAIRKPIVWTLHDCWAFTGICHYYDHCDNFTKSCGSCWVLNSTCINDLSHEVWHKKFKAYEGCDIHVVTPSRWLRESALRSSLLGKFPISVIPYPINTNKFKPVDKLSARKALNLHDTKKYILFGATNALNDIRKGFNYVKEAFELFDYDRESDIELILFGTKEEESTSINGYKVTHISDIDDDIRLIHLFSAADIVIVPSISENLSLVIMESLACGTPVVAFDIGGNSDLIEHKKNGYLAVPYSTEGIANGIQWCLKGDQNKVMSEYARQKMVDKYSESYVSNQYRQLYESLL